MPTDPRSRKSLWRDTIPVTSFFLILLAAAFIGLLMVDPFEFLHVAKQIGCSLLLGYRAPNYDFCH